MYQWGQLKITSLIRLGMLEWLETPLIIKSARATILYVQPEMKFRSPPSYFHHEPPLSKPQCRIGVIQDWPPILIKLSEYHPKSITSEVMLQWERSFTPCSDRIHSTKSLYYYFVGFVISDIMIMLMIFYCGLVVHITDTRAQKVIAVHQRTLQKRCLHMTNTGRSKAVYPHHSCIVIRKSTENG